MQQAKPLPPTEQAHAHARGLDLLPDKDVLAILLGSQLDAAAAVHAAGAELAQAAACMAASMRSGGRLIYVAAGSSGLMALADGIELHATFGLPRSAVVALIAGGQPSIGKFANDAEDSAAAGKEQMKRLAPNRRDCVIGVAASGRTPYTVAAVREAKRSRSKTVGIANNPATPLLAAADTAVLLPTPPEAVAGSTRLGAATAQKVALNALSTLMAIKLGHVLDGRMVNMKADSTKLRMRAKRIVAEAAGCSASRAAACLAQAQGSIKHAILLAQGAPSLAQARRMLQAAGGCVRKVQEGQPKAGR